MLVLVPRFVLLDELTPKKRHRNRRINLHQHREFRVVLWRILRVGQRQVKQHAEKLQLLGLNDFLAATLHLLICCVPVLPMRSFGVLGTCAGAKPWLVPRRLHARHKILVANVGLGKCRRQQAIIMCLIMQLLQEP